MDKIYEDDRYLKEQLITYIGNKRSLLNYINKEIELIKNDLKKDKLITIDLFSGSGVVARLMKQHSSKVIANDLEAYSRVINECYLSNKSEFDYNKYMEYKKELLLLLDEKKVKKSIISKHYAPKNDKKIKYGERVFYTAENAKRIDIIREFINNVDEDYKKYFMAPLLHNASVHTNTGGIFKGFYKDANTGIGKFGGTKENALKRILGEITVDTPVLSNFETDYFVYQKDANELVNELSEECFDLAYIDPPYNQHPYGSNYFMLNVIVNQKINPKSLSKVSGIPSDWNRSQYNRKADVLKAFEELIVKTNATYILVSYNSEGFLNLDEISNVMKKYGSLEVKEIKYNTYRASRNLSKRNIHVKEYIFKLKKG